MYVEASFVFVMEKPCSEDCSETDEKPADSDGPVHPRASDKYLAMAALREQHPRRRLLRKVSSNASQEPLPAPPPKKGKSPPAASQMHPWIFDGKCYRQVGTSQQIAANWVERGGFKLFIFADGEEYLSEEVVLLDELPDTSGKKQKIKKKPAVLCIL